MDALSQIFEDIHLKKTEYLYIKTAGDWAFSSEEQPAFMAHIVLHGNAFLQIKEDVSLQLNTGDLVLIAAGSEHTLRSQAQQTLTEQVSITPLFEGLREDAIELGQENANHHRALILSIRCHMDMLMARPLIHALPTYLHVQNILHAQEPEWLRIGLYFVAAETQRIQPGRHKIMDHIISILFIECVRDYIAQLTDQNNWLAALNHAELSHALMAIHGRPEHAWTVETLADTCCMSRSKFASVFHQMIGETPLAYLQQHRLRLASQYLRQGQLPIQQIAYRVGYSSETAFSQVFKRYYQVSPKQYRQDHVNSLTDGSEK